MKEVKKTYDASYIEYEPGDLVWSMRNNETTGLDWQRIYKVVEFTPPADPSKDPHGRVKLANRLHSVSTKHIRLATNENFRSYQSTGIPQDEVEYFEGYLEWLTKGEGRYSF